jgi:hypothetical protein
MSTAIRMPHFEQTVTLIPDTPITTPLPPDVEHELLVDWFAARIRQRDSETALNREDLPGGTLAAAAHEAGHAILAELAGASVTAVEIHERTGQCAYSGRLGAIAELRVSVAGYVAERVLLDRRHPHWQSSDFADARRLALRVRSAMPWGTRGTISTSTIIWREIAYVERHLRAHLDQLQRLAVVLHERRVLDGDEVRQLIGTEYEQQRCAS